MPTTRLLSVLAISAALGITGCENDADFDDPEDFGTPAAEQLDEDVFVDDSIPEVLPPEGYTGTESREEMYDEESAETTP